MNVNATGVSTMTDRTQPWTRADTFSVVGVILLAFIVRLAFVLAVHPMPVSDASWYYGRALGIVHGLGYTVNGYPTAYWPPGWPYFLAMIVWLFGPSVLPAVIVQSAFGALTTGIVFLIGRDLSDRVTGVVAGVAYALLPSAIEWSAVLMSEPLYTFLWASITYIWLTHSTRSLGWYAVSGLLAGAAALVRPSALLFWGVLLVYLLTLPQERRHLPRMASAVAVTVFCTMLVVVPWIIRDYHVYGTLVVISNNGGVSLFEGNNSIAAGDTQLHDARIQKLIDDPRTEVQADRLSSQLATEYIARHPLGTLVSWMRNVKNLYYRDGGSIQYSLRAAHYREPQSPSDRLATFVLNVNTVAYAALMVFALIGIALCCGKRWNATKNVRWRLIAGMILYNTLLFVPIGGADRYRYPTMPYFAVFAGIGIVAAWAYANNVLASRVEAPSKS
jgi:4-amino-4-deoxy-L-arabinose transferase-like glycosyltransferase